MTIDGALLEAVLKASAGYLLFVTDDVPFEEGPRILWLDENLAVCDWALMAAPYVTGVFSDLQIADAHRATFRFSVGPAWALEVFEASRLVVPFPGQPYGVWRPMSLTRRFTLKQQ